MKTSLLFFCLLCTAFFCRSQPPAFSSVSLHNSGGREILVFSTPQENNVRHYRIEASNDDVNYEVVATIPARGNNVQPTAYRYDVTLQPFSWFRVGEVKMGGEMPYSSVVKKESSPRPVEQQKPAPKAQGGASPAVVTN